MAIPITEGVQAATAIAQTISNIVDQAKRRKFEQSLALLNSKQVNELNQKMLEANTESQRLQILSDSLIQYAIANEQSTKTSKVMLLVLAGGLGVCLLTVALIFALKKKNP